MELLASGRSITAEGVRVGADGVAAVVLDATGVADGTAEVALVGTGAAETAEVALGDTEAEGF
jgi:hypothetical protein